MLSDRKANVSTAIRNIVLLVNGIIAIVMFKDRLLAFSSSMNDKTGSTLVNEVHLISYRHVCAGESLYNYNVLCLKSMTAFRPYPCNDFNTNGLFYVSAIDSDSELRVLEYQIEITVQTNISPKFTIIVTCK
jgi:hypothetical protein